MPRSGGKHCTTSRILSVRVCVGLHWPDTHPNVSQQSQHRGARQTCRLEHECESNPPTARQGSRSWIIARIQHGEQASHKGKTRCHIYIVVQGVQPHDYRWSCQLVVWPFAKSAQVPIRWESVHGVMSTDRCPLPNGLDLHHVMFVSQTVGPFAAPR